MKIFLDTANLEEIRRAAEAGLIDGVTTNPSLLAKAAKDRPPRDLFREIAEIVPGPVSAEVVATDAAAMVSEGEKLAGIHPRIVVKVPLTEDGLKACRTLRSRGVGVNVTLCFSPVQALLAAKADATFVSPFVGRLDDVASEGMRLIAQIREIYDRYAFRTEILVASVRHPQHVVEAALLGADCVTLPPAVLWQMLRHPLTDAGVRTFLEDWKASGKSLL